MLSANDSVQDHRNIHDGRRITHARLGDYAQAAATYARALMAKTAAHGQRHPSVAKSCVGLSWVMERLGDKARARALAAQCSVPLLTGTDAATGIEQARDFLSALGEGRSMMIKAIAGGGGRGMRVVHHVDEVEPAYLRCQSEARNAFGNGDLAANGYAHAKTHTNSGCQQATHLQH
jgi:biotin carboxylase